MSIVRFKCEVCKKVYKNRGFLNDHMMSFHASKVQPPYKSKPAVQKNRKVKIAGEEFFFKCVVDDTGRFKGFIKDDSLESLKRKAKRFSTQGIIFTAKRGERKVVK